jgi:hypothetical protein
MERPSDIVARYLGCSGDQRNAKYEVCNLYLAVRVRSSLNCEKKDGGAWQDMAAMDKVVEGKIRGLAQPLWESAARPYGMAMDFWLMAEQMVLEVASATARMQNKAVTLPEMPRVEEPPTAVPVHKVRALAECMWESAGRQYGMAQDFWLAAERHVLAMLRASMPSTGSEASHTRELAALSPSAYLDQIRVAAYHTWEAAGQRYGQALDYWLQAEREMLRALTAPIEPAVEQSGTPAAESQQSEPAAASSPGIAAEGEAAPADPHVIAAEDAAAASVPDVKIDAPEPAAPAKPTKPRRSRKLAQVALHNSES